MTTQPENRPGESDFAAMTERLLAKVELQKGAAKKASRIRVGSLIGVLLIGAPLAIAGTWIYVSQVEKEYAVTCYESDDVRSFGLRVATVADDTDRGRVERALENCAAAWSHGLVREGAPSLNETGHTVPPLTACRTSFDEVVVFPSNSPDVCQRSGLQEIRTGTGTN